jgi:hypothetical protein
MSERLTTDQKQKVRRDHAAATVRQLATVLAEIGANTMNDDRTYYQYGGIALNKLATRIEKGELNPRRWEFLTWIMEPKDLDSLDQNANSVTSKSSG